MTHKSQNVYIGSYICEKPMTHNLKMPDVGHRPEEAVRKEPQPDFFHEIQQEIQQDALHLKLHNVKIQWSVT